MFLNIDITCNHLCRHSFSQESLHDVGPRWYPSFHGDLRNLCTHRRLSSAVVFTKADNNPIHRRTRAGVFDMVSFPTESPFAKTLFCKRLPQTLTNLRNRSSLRQCRMPNLRGGTDSRPDFATVRSGRYYWLSYPRRRFTAKLRYIDALIATRRPGRRVSLNCPPQNQHLHGLVRLAPH